MYRLYRRERDGKAQSSTHTGTQKENVDSCCAIDSAIWVTTTKIEKEPAPCALETLLISLLYKLYPPTPIYAEEEKGERDALESGNERLLGIIDRNPGAGALE